MKIYTRTGDKGQTSLYGGKRISKSDPRVEAYGTVDELNSAIGIAIAQYQKSNSKYQKYILKIKKELVNIQHDLFSIGATLADLRIMNNESRIKNLESRVKQMEYLIDELMKELPELHNFILPGGGKAGSLLHFVRSVCRRTERRIVALSKKEKVDESILTYFNRLSDLLFTMARFINYQERQKEIGWTK